VQHVPAHLIGDARREQGNALIAGSRMAEG
jgi:hypothetical protein